MIVDHRTPRWRRASRIGVRAAPVVLAHLDVSPTVDRVANEVDQLSGAPRSPRATRRSLRKACVSMSMARLPSSRFRRLRAVRRPT